MARLNWKQMLIAIALGLLFATLQGDPPLRALGRLSSMTCSLRSSPERC
jgi:hypothetical protein